MRRLLQHPHYALLLGRVAAGIYATAVRMTRGCYCWTPPLVVDGPSKREVPNTLTGILDVCRTAGLHTPEVIPGS